jgi:ribosome biogenesis GTPase / thiamine phosphate phosphatase
VHASRIEEVRVVDGVVIRAGSGSCRVAAEGSIVLCSLRGRLKQGRQRSQNVVAVGDKVRMKIMKDGSDEGLLRGVVEEVLPRHNRFSRQAARRSGGHLEQVLMANLDQVVAVQSVAAPAPQGCLVDRLLVSAARYEVPSVLCLNKIDLDLEASELDRWRYYQELGIEVVRTSALTGVGLSRLEELLRDRISILLGASGVGKSSLLNGIHPGLRLRTGDVTAKTGLGRHVTTHTELFPLTGGGFIADSPGLRGFDPWDLPPHRLKDFWPDLVRLSGACRFRTCMHRDEPDCGVKQALAAGDLPGWRYEAYLTILRDLEDRWKDRSYA